MNKILEKLDEMAKRREAATKGPWCWGHGAEDHFIIVEDVKSNKRPIIAEIKTGTLNNQHSNFDFIAAARTEHELLERALRIALETLSGCYDQREIDSVNQAFKKIEALFAEGDVSVEEKK